MGGAPTLKTKSVKFNFIMNMILTASSFIFPLITFPYVSRVLLVEGNGYVSFATSVLTYFTMFASLGIPSYGIRACAQVRDDKKELSKVTQELLIINIATTLLVSIVFVVTLFTVPQFKEQQTLLWINGATLILNAIGVNWLYSALEQYKGDAQENELNINLQIIEPKHNINTGQIETEIKEAETDLEDDDSWGDNLYTP